MPALILNGHTLHVTRKSERLEIMRRINDHSDEPKSVYDTLFREGETIDFPNAIASDYNVVLDRLGFTKVTVDDWTSSAGDWTCFVRGGLVSQETRTSNTVQAVLNTGETVVICAGNAAY